MVVPHLAPGSGCQGPHEVVFDVDPARPRYSLVAAKDSCVCEGESAIGCDIGYQTCRGSYLWILCHEERPEEKENASVDIPLDRGSADPCLEETWNWDFHHNVDHEARVLHLLWHNRASEIVFGVLQPAALPFSYYAAVLRFRGLFMSEADLKPALTKSIHLRIFLPRTACPCSASRARRHDSVSKN